MIIHLNVLKASHGGNSGVLSVSNGKQTASSKIIFRLHIKIAKCISCSCYDNSMFHTFIKCLLFMMYDLVSFIPILLFMYIFLFSHVSGPSLLFTKLTFIYTIIFYSHLLTRDLDNLTIFHQMKMYISIFFSNKVNQAVNLTSAPNELFLHRHFRHVGCLILIPAST